MNPRYLLAPGAHQLFDVDMQLLGFAVAEDTSNGQIQRWIFRKTPRSFSMMRWERDINLDQWKAMVSTPAPSASTWGQAPELGLWLPNALYVVATSLCYSYGTSGEYCFTVLPWPLPQPLGAGSSAMSSVTKGLEASDCSARRDRQIDIGDHIVHQFINEVSTPVGRVFGEGGLSKPSGSAQWQSSEYWLLKSNFQRAGSSASPTQLRAGTLGPDAPLRSFYEMIDGEWTSGCTLEVTGCSNYQDISPPPTSLL